MRRRDLAKRQPYASSLLGLVWPNQGMESGMSDWFGGDGLNAQELC